MATPREMFDQILATVKGLTITQKIMAVVVLAVVVGGLVSISMVGGEADYKVLFSGLSQQDAAEVVAKLQDMNTPYELAQNGTAIMVPAGQVYEVRLNLAGEGLPRGGGVGFEIFDETSLGTTDFVQRLNYQRALQGELARTISQFQQVQEARVHIATPKESVFVEDEKPPTASVSVKLKGREKLSKLQIQSIVNLVASAVPGLTTDNVTLVDTTGRLLYRRQGDDDPVLSGTQLEYQFKIEETLRRKIESMIEEIVGVDRVRARVNAEMDFSRIDVTEESFDPEGQVVRSEQLLTERDLSDGLRPEGIPGVKGELATFAEEGENTDQANGYKRNNITRNYEVSRQTKHVQETTGTIKRLSVAVMVDGSYEKSKGDDGKPVLQYSPRSPEEMQYFDKLVRNTIGYNEDRGDQVEVVSMAFALSTMPEPEVSAMDKWRPLIEWVAMPLVYLLIALAVILFVIRPFFKLMAARQLETQKLAALGEQTRKEVVEEEELAFGPKGMTDQERIYRLAQSDPDRAADLVRRWLREEA